jgi:hypothetical protein
MVSALDASRLGIDRRRCFDLYGLWSFWGNLGTVHVLTSQLGVDYGDGHTKRGKLGNGRTHLASALDEHRIVVPEP